MLWYTEIKKKKQNRQQEVCFALAYVVRSSRVRARPIYCANCSMCTGARLNDPNREFFTTKNDFMLAHRHIHMEYVRINR